ncbi:glycosyltransferase family 1 protein [Microbulbifer sp. OS29]|uniref:Glycosyltransferase family 1 protein n=1 Tax=Microbulbifer okhotskensis TaxID=2926617 RepID=A0A9X2EMK3_9GAMM|nr:glycosyltransferase family 1 protein [Microbulbifer okhotskensis]MCO1334481.1 glycosyltransferase family 1 protein [Microbulbifer okhotskensis]
MTGLDRVSRWLIVEEGRNPSTDYFILPYLRKLGVDAERLTFDQLPAEGQLQGAEVIFVRYVPSKWQSLLDQNLAKISKIHFFMDDDLFDWRAFTAMPLRYQAKILRYSWSKQHWLKSVGAQLWVSTPYLQQKYSDWSPELLQAGPLKAASEPALNVFYHGSASHQADIHWLLPVIEEVLERNSRLTFEIIGNTSVNRLFCNIPRVKVLHPMKWPTYLSMLQGPGRTIGLAPLLDSPFNRARSHTKFFDITLSGAVGIYAEGDIYSKVVRHRENGLLLPMQASIWVDGILGLAENELLRESLLVEARKCL